MTARTPDGTWARRPPTGIRAPTATATATATAIGAAGPAVQHCYAVPVGPDSSHSHRAGPARRVSRRSLLAAFPLLAVVAPACGTEAQPTEPDPRDIAAATGAVRTERELLAAYDDAIARHRGLAGPLGVVRAHHAEHVQELEAAVPSAPSAPASPTATATTPTTPRAATPPTAPTTATATGNPGPAVQAGIAGPAATLGELAHLERTAATAHRAGCLAATGPLATLLAGLHAAETAHADLLGLLGGTAGR